MGRAKIEIDTAEVARLAGLGLTQREICASLGISQDTLTRRKVDSADFADAMERGKSESAIEVSSALFEACKHKNVPAIIWYEKTRRGLTDKLQIDIVKQELEAALDLLRNELAPDEYAKVIGILARRSGAAAD